MRKLRLAVLISGRGSNLKALIEACNAPDFPAEISVVLSNKASAGGLTYATDSGIPVQVVPHKHYDRREDFERAMSAALKPYSPDLVCLAGFMRVLTPVFVSDWQGRLINIHPSLLPDYKGLNTHERALADGRDESGCTVHFVSEDVDSGDHIIQKHVPILKDDSHDTLAARVLEAEHQAYAQAIEILAQKMLKDTGS